MTSALEHVRRRVAGCMRSFAARYPVLEGVLIALLSTLGIAAVSRFLTPLVFYNSDSAVCWPTDGLVLAILLISRRKHWPWIVAGFVVNLVRFDISVGFTAVGSMVDCASNLFEVLLPAFCLPRFTNLSDWLRKPNLVARFCAFALLLGPGVAAAFAQIYNSHHLGMNYLSIFTKWMASDSLGMALFTPLVLVLVSRETWEMLGRGKWLRNGSLMGILLLAGWVVFHQTSFSLEFLLFPVLVVIVNVVGFSGAVFCLTGLAMIAATATIHGTGPFLLLQGSQAPYRVLMLQIFLITAMLMSFAVTLIQLERRAFEEQLNSALQQMEMLATHDSLTGLGNRRLFENTLEAEWHRAMRDGRSLALLLLDADCFKSYNDLYGHLAGDTCLCLIASVLKPTVRREGDLAARYGGEEFIVLLPGSNLDDALRAAEDIRQRIEALNVAHRGNPYLLVTVSVGCSAVVPSPEMKPKELIKEADQALYLAKHAGRNRVEARQRSVLANS